jgi:diacylglycerol kinase family enzyme
VKAFAVFNPAAHRGRLEREWPAIAAALRTIYPSLIATPSGGRGQTARLVRDALREGHMEIVAVGGDGTINEAVNGFFEQGTQGSPDAVLSVVPAGGGDIGGSGAGVAAALSLARAPVRTVDLGHVACVAPDGQAATRFFLGAASLGLTGDIARRLNRSRFLPVRAVQETLALAAWRACRVRLMADGGQDEIDGIAAVAVMNRKCFGNGLKAAPGADPTDGVFEIVVLPGGRRDHIGRVLRGLRTGGNDAPLRRLRATHLTAAPTLDTSRPVWVETDGEAAGVLPATFEIVPRALRLRI